MVASPRSRASWVDLLEQHGDAGVGVGHRDAAAHRAGADDGRPADRQQRRLLGDAGDLAHLALAEEDVNQRLRLIGEQALRETAPPPLAALGEGQRGGGLDRVDRLAAARIRPRERLLTASRTAANAFALSAGW